MEPTHYSSIEDVNPRENADRGNGTQENGSNEAREHSLNGLKKAARSNRVVVGRGGSAQTSTSPLREMTNGVIA